MRQFDRLFAFAIALTFAGCSTPPTGGADMPGGNQDLAGTASDLTTPPDLIPSLAPTGAPCTKATECAGTKPQCLLKDQQGNLWPGGYCISQCNPQKNDPKTELNTACPGGNGTCRGQGTMGICETWCTKSDGTKPCTRMGYACFQACEPLSRSQCDPTIKGVCDAGAACARIGADKVGLCQPSCDPFMQNCPDDNGNPQGCYPSDDTGEAFCFTVYSAPGDMDGAMCIYTNGCAVGLTCYDPDPNGTMGICRPFCGGANNVMCMNGKKCIDLSMNVKVATLGVCGG